MLRSEALRSEPGAGLAASEVRTYRELKLTFEDRSCWSLPWLLRERARTHGDRIYLDAPGEEIRLTYAETLAKVEQIANALIATGTSPGDRLLIMSSNRAEVILAWFGSAMAAMAEVPINTAYRGSFLEHQVQTTAPRVAVVEASLAEAFCEISEIASIIERFYILGSESDVARAIDTLAPAGVNAEPFTSLVDSTIEPRELPWPRPQDLAAVFFTSGTTGPSKGVMMSHSHMFFFADQCVSLTRLSDADTYMSVGPLFHGNAQFLAAYPALIAGARFVLRERFSASRWSAEIRESGATVTNLVGIMMDWVFKQPASPDDADNDLRCVFAAPTASSILEPFKRRFGVAAFVELFALTETSAPLLSPYGAPRPRGAVGLVADEYFDVKLVDPETDEEVPVGEVGELVVRTKIPWTMCSGYFNMPAETAAAQRNLWFHTGDGMRRDEDGWYYFVDRLKDSIRRRGENISSYEIEQAILEHEAVGQCAAVAAPAAAEAGEDEVAVFAVPAEGAELDTESLRTWCVRRLPRFAVPAYLTILDELPTTPSGKIRKAVLREQAASLAASQESR